MTNITAFFHYTLATYCIIRHFYLTKLILSPTTFHETNPAGTYYRASDNLEDEESVPFAESDYYY